MLDVLIEIVSAVADVFVDSWINRVIARFVKKRSSLLLSTARSTCCQGLQSKKEERKPVRKKKRSFLEECFL